LAAGIFEIFTKQRGDVLVEREIGREKDEQQKSGACWPGQKGRESREKENFYALLSLANTTFAFYVLVVSYQCLYIYIYVPI